MSGSEDEACYKATLVLQLHALPLVLLLKPPPPLKQLWLMPLLRRGVRRERCDVHGNKYTAMQTAVPSRS